MSYAVSCCFYISVSVFELWKCFSLAVSHLVYAFANLLAPIVIFHFHPKWALLIGSMGFLFYNASFLYLNTYLFYFASLVLGTGFASNCLIYHHRSFKHLHLSAIILVYYLKGTEWSAMVDL